MSESQPTDNKDYKSTFKNTVAFGGLQVITIVLSIIKGKFLAVFLGPAGIGINNLFVNTMNMITTFNDFGLDVSAVRNISEAKENDNEEKSALTINVVRKLFLWTGIFGAILTILISPLLSKFTFGSYDYTYSFILLGLFVLFTTITKRQQTVFRGLRQINLILKSGLAGSVLSLIFTLPLFYLYGDKAIVPSLLITSLITLLASQYYYRKLNLQPVDVPNKIVVSEGKEMVKLGIMLIVSILIGMIVKYLIGVGISKMGSIKDVGLYTAATSITAQYIGFILTALSADYFPKLSAVHKDIPKLNKVVNDQAEIVIILATPILIVMLITAPVLIRFFLTKEFIEITSFIRFIALGSFFQIFSYCLGYISFAKNDRKTYLILEAGIGASSHLVFTLLCYYIWGFKGFGYAFVFIYVLYTFIIIFVTSRLYQFKINKDKWKIYLINFAFIATAFIALLLSESVVSYAISSAILVVSSIYSYKNMNQNMGIGLTIKNKINTLKNKIKK